MRCVGLARSSLQHHADASATSIDDGLGRAHAAMKHMAALLDRALRQNAAAASTAATCSATAMFDTRQSLQHLGDELAGLLAPHAQAAATKLQFEIPDDCAELPAGALGPVLMNGLRNALQACGADVEKPAAVTTTFARRQSMLFIDIVGPAGHKDPGRGIGLPLSEQIVREMGGELSLVTSAESTTFRVCVPIENLQRHA